MKKERLYARDVLKRSWILFSEHIGVFLSVSLVYIMIALATGFTLVLAAGNDLNGTLSAEQMSAARWPFKIIMVLAGLYTFIMCHSMINGTITAIRTSDGRPETAPRFSDFFMVNKSVILGMFTTIFRVIVIAIPTLVFSGIGYFVRENDYAVMACSVGVISVSFTLSVFTAYATFHSIEDGVSPWNAVRKSCIDVSKDTTLVLVCLAASLLMIVASSAALMVPLVVSIPFTMIMNTYVYAMLKNFHPPARKSKDRATGNSEKKESVDSDSAVQPAAKGAEDTLDSATKDFSEVLNDKADQEIRKDG